MAPTSSHPQTPRPDDDDEEEQDVDPDNLPDFGEFQTEMDAMRRERARKEEERRAELKRQWDTKKAAETAQMDAELKVRVALPLLTPFFALTLLYASPLQPPLPRHRITPVAYCRRGSEIGQGQRGRHWWRAFDQGRAKAPHAGGGAVYAL